MTETKEADFDTLSVAERAEQLLALFDKKNNVLALDERAEIIRPETSIAQSSLFTGAIHEPQMFTELKKEIASADRIDMLVSNVVLPIELTSKLPYTYIIDNIQVFI